MKKSQFINVAKAKFTVDIVGHKSQNHMNHLKERLLILLIGILLSTQLSAQNEDGKRVQLQFGERVPFFAVDNRYNLMTDTIYYVNDGFRVYSGYDTITINDKKHVIFRYPKWTGQNQEIDLEEEQQEKTLIDTLFLESIKNLYTNDSSKLVVYNEILDSLKILADKKRIEKPVRVELIGRSNLKLAMPQDDFERLKLEEKIQDVYSLKWRYSTKLASGFMSVPFKLRPKQDTVNFSMTTDITLGAYIGVKKRISRKNNSFLVLPVTLGLSYINVGNNETSNVNTENNSSVVPGWTWSSGLVFDLNGFNIGFVIGQDFASGVGNDWIYNKKLWYSFSIGYSFFNSGNKN